MIIRQPVAQHLIAPVSRRGFTLVEILVVIGIIALLMGMLLPTLKKAWTQARTVQCSSNLRQIGLALQMYTGQYGGALPPGFDQNADATVYNWTSLLVAMMDRKGATNSAADLASGGPSSSFRKVFICPELAGQGADYDPNDVAVAHYLAHPRLMPILNLGVGGPDQWVRTYGTDPNAVLRPYKLPRLKRSSEITMVFDGSMNLLNGIGEFTAYSGSPYYRPRQGMPVADFLDGANLSQFAATTHLIADWTHSSQKSDAPVTLPPYDAATGMQSSLRFTNEDVVGNDRNIRFRHGDNDQMNALFGDGHVSGFRTSKRNLATNPPTAGDLKCGNIMLDQP
jgi:prepilin-type N-terminal cleavage/methylation domain-containing protein/prepilin-type processing-associated H-X9-DG protein